MSRVSMGEVPNRTGGGGTTPAVLGPALRAMQLQGLPYFDDCELPVTANTIPYILNTGGSGASAASYTNVMYGAPGQTTFGTGTTSTGRTGDRTHTLCFSFGDGEATVARRLQLPVLSTAGDRYSTVVGFINVGTGVDQTNGAYFEYDEGGVAAGGSASPNWKIVTVNGSGKTRTTTTVPVDINTWYKLVIVVNADASQADFYINDVLVGTHTTYIPQRTTSARFGAGFHTLKSAGTTAVVTIVDFHGHHVTCVAR